MAYIDGYVCAVPTGNREKYAAHAAVAAKMFKKHGALSTVEGWGDDVPDGEVTSFPLAVKKKDDETVVFAWIMWPSKAVRNEAMPKAMSDPDWPADMKEMPFDGKRMIFGGFEVMLEA